MSGSRRGGREVVGWVDKSDGLDGKAARWLGGKRGREAGVGVSVVAGGRG